MATKKKTAPKKNVKKPSRPAKKAEKKRVVRKPAKKIAPKKKVLKKAAPRKAVQKAPAKKIVKKPIAKKVSPKKGTKKAAPRKIAKKALPKAPGKKPAPVAKPVARPAKPPRAFRKEELAAFRSHLQQQLDLVQDNLNALASDNLKRSPIEATGDISAHSTHMADQGTDNFDRELALNLASGRQESIYEIEDAIRRVDDGSYGACELCGNAIERQRLKALPFAKKCMVCQNAAERGRTKYRPFGGTLPLQQLAAEDAAESPDSMG